MMIERPSLTALLLCTALFSIVPRHGYAQVSTNLSDLPPPEAAPHTETSHTNTASSKRATPTHTAHQNHTTTPAHNNNQGTPPGYTRVPSVPVAPPPPVIIAPPFTPIPTHPPVAPEPIAATPSAHSHTAPYEQSGLRIIFDTNTADMNDDTIKAIQQFGAREASQTEHRLVLHSYATLPGDDLSMPRRVALARALAVRSLLMQSGIASTRIYPIAQGRPDAARHDPADRLDITVEENAGSLSTATTVASPDTLPVDTKGTTAP
ncbi:hypothetical protein GS501_01020 [Saccharibacter sp. 17.LH.SD]|uniref:hypothetical protein n=1 Tax=Saccharibacter sp. 17.LH.SD TaxID=2689393 RepID=UPI0013696729|nr:hypothetical protein [Saccharibacter sp. 17.LH.SD]MXV43656.1 hypothetical protein [Saccharibacter sp. 17.LH.SD]